MRYPKIKYAQAIDDHNLLIEFDNSEKKKYDISPLLAYEMFRPLRNPAFFKAVQVDKGGYGVVWNESIDISEYELWKNGQELTQEEQTCTSLPTRSAR
jgi:hypothetical protein